MFAGYGVLLAAVYAAAIFSREPTLRWAMMLIVLSWFATRLWKVFFAHYTFGYGLIDFALMAAFIGRWRARQSYIAMLLAIVQASFLALHFFGTLFDLSFLAPPGKAYPDYFVEAMARNVLFILSLAVIGGIAGVRIGLIHSKTFGRFVEKWLRRFFGIERRIMRKRAQNMR